MFFSTGIWFLFVVLRWLCSFSTEIYYCSFNFSALDLFILLFQILFYRSVLSQEAVKDFNPSSTALGLWFYFLQVFLLCNLLLCSIPKLIWPKKAVTDDGLLRSLLRIPYMTNWQLRFSVLLKLTTVGPGRHSLCCSNHWWGGTQTYFQANMNTSIICWL